MPVVRADEFRLPAPGVMVHLSPPLDPPILKGIKVHPDNPFRFDFILDQGDSVIARSGATKQSQQEQLKTEATKLIKYFLASLTIPEKDLWVNLSPYEKDRIIPQSFGLTEMGRDLLAEDYMLKQITASLIYPEDEIGKKFWKRVYEEAAKKFGTTNIPVNTFNKVWIVPEKAVVYENTKAGTAYVVESKLKVMLEQDYLALEKNQRQPVDMFKSELQRTCPQAGCQPSKALNVKAPQVNNGSTSESVSALGSQIVREIVIPELTKEVNEDKNFARLRQVYNSLILATWYKNKIKTSILSQVYADRNKIAGVNNDDPQEKQRIYQLYLKAFKKGVYNYIKEDFDPASQETIPRKYFSGGVDLAMAPQGATSLANAAMLTVDSTEQARDAAAVADAGNVMEITAVMDTAPALVWAGRNLAIPPDARPIEKEGQAEIYRHPEDPNKVIEIFTFPLIANNQREWHIEALKQLYKAFKADPYLKDRIPDVVFTRVDFKGRKDVWGIVRQAYKGTNLEKEILSRTTSPGFIFNREGIRLQNEAFEILSRIDEISRRTLGVPLSYRKLQDGYRSSSGSYRSRSDQESFSHFMVLPSGEIIDLDPVNYGRLMVSMMGKRFANVTQLLSRMDPNIFGLFERLYDIDKIAVDNELRNERIEPIPSIIFSRTLLKMLKRKVLGISLKLNHPVLAKVSSRIARFKITADLLNVNGGITRSIIIPLDAEDLRSIKSGKKINDQTLATILTERLERLEAPYVKTGLTGQDAVEKSNKAMVADWEKVKDKLFVGYYLDLGRFNYVQDHPQSVTETEKLKIEENLNSGRREFASKVILELEPSNDKELEHSIQIAGQVIDQATYLHLSAEQIEIEKQIIARLIRETYDTFKKAKILNQNDSFKPELLDKDYLFNGSTFWNFLTKVNHSFEPKTVYIVTEESPEAIIAQIRERLLPIKDDELTYVAIQRQDPHTGQILHVGVIDYAKKFRNENTLKDILAGRAVGENYAPLLNRYIFYLRRTQYPKENTFHFNQISIGRRDTSEFSQKNLQGKGFGSEIYRRMAELLKKRYSGWRVTTVDGSGGWTRKYFMRNFAGVEIVKRDSDLFNRIKLMEGTAIDPSHPVLIGWAFDSAMVNQDVSKIEIETDGISDDFLILHLKVFDQLMGDIRSKLGDAGNILAEKFSAAHDIKDTTWTQTSFRTVLRELFSNAFRAIRESGKRGKIEIKTGLENGQFVINFADTGIGIDPQIIDKIFDQSFSTRGSDGVGLTYVRRFIEQVWQGADIKAFANTAGGSGTTFKITIPIGYNNLITDETNKEGNRAMIGENKGGIDFNSDKMNLQVKMDSRFRGNDNGRAGNGKGIQFHITPAMLAQLQNAPGFVPVIINIQPLNSLKSFLGIDDLDSR